MKIRGVLFFCLILLALFCGTSERSAYAVSTPYAVIGEDVWMLGETGNKLFLLPETYYAKIEKMDDAYYYIVFNGVSGKIPKGSVSVVGYDKTVRDTQKIIRIADEYSVFTAIKAKPSLEGEEGEELIIPTGEPFTYIGTYKQGESVYYYVSFGGQYGYVLNTFTDMPIMRTETFIPEQDEPVEEQPEEPTEEPKEEVDLVKILIIGGVSAALLILIIVLFLPRKNKKHKYYYS